MRTAVKQNTARPSHRNASPVEPPPPLQRRRPRSPARSPTSRSPPPRPFSPPPQRPRPRSPVNHSPASRRLPPQLQRYMSPPPGKPVFRNSRSGTEQAPSPLRAEDPTRGDPIPLPRYARMYPITSASQTQPAPHRNSDLCNRPDRPNWMNKPGNLYLKNSINITSKAQPGKARAKGKERARARGRARGRGKERESKEDVMCAGTQCITQAPVLTGRSHTHGRPSCQFHLSSGRDRSDHSNQNGSCPSKG